MEFSYSREQQMVKQMLKDFAETEIAPISAEIDEKAEYPYETIAKLGKLGLMGMPFPPEYGGAGSDYLTYIMAIEEISKVDASHGVIIQTHNALCCWPIFTYGTEEQKRKYLPDLLSGKHLGAFGLTEPNAGTDAAGTQTKAVMDGDEWVLNGSKIFISGGGIADVYIINTCTVTNLADRKSRQYIRRMKKQAPEAIVAVTGCYAQVSPEELAAMEEVDIVAGTGEKNNLLAYVEEFRQNRQEQLHIRAYDELTEYTDRGIITSMESRTRAYIKIQEGCNRFCDIA